MSLEYAVGYGKPPRHSRFRPGQSGNPCGRPKGALGLKATARKVLRQTVTVREGEVVRRVTRLEAVLLSLIARAGKGDAKAIAMVLELSRLGAGRGARTVGRARRRGEAGAGVAAGQDRRAARRGAGSGWDGWRRGAGRARARWRRPGVGGERAARAGGESAADAARATVVWRRAGTRRRTSGVLPAAGAGRRPGGTSRHRTGMTGRWLATVAHNIM